MTKFNKLISFGSLAAAMALSACGGVPGAPGGGGAPVVVNPIDGMDYDAVAKVGVTEGNEVSFDFVNNQDRFDARTGGNVTFYSGEQEDNGVPDGSQRVRIRFNIDDGTVQSERVLNTAYNEGFYNTTDREVRVSTVTVGGQELIRASEMSLDGFSDTATGTESFVYIPANSNGNAYVGMVGLTGGDTLDAGIFGTRTTEAQVSAQNGTATYSGVTEAYVRSGVNAVEGVYNGDVTASIDFDAAGAPTFSTSATMTPELGGTDTINYNVVGSIGRDGTMNATSGTLQGQSTSALELNGGLYGPNAESMGYAYSLTGQGQYPTTISGGAILNQTNP